MYVISLVFFGFAVRNHKDKYIPTALAMMLWFLMSAMAARPTELTMPYLDILRIAEKVVFAVMTVLLLLLCILRRRPLCIDWLPLAGTLLSAAVRVGWYVFFGWYQANPGEDPIAAMERLTLYAGWKEFLLQAIICAVAVWHIYWISRPRFLK